MSRRFLASVALGVALIGCGDDDAAPVEAWDWAVPAGLPAPVVPEQNPMSREKVRLGRLLFYDTRLSVDGDMSCASCHEQARGFSDGLALPSGTTGDIVPRNAMALTNVAYRASYGWANPVLVTLEDQALVPLLGEFPIELGVSGNEREVLDRLASEATYRELFGAAFPDQPSPVTLENVAASIACFERTLLSYDSPYDRWSSGDEQAMTDAAKRGHDLFFSERAECYHCHGSTDFSNSFRSTAWPDGVHAFHNTGLYNLGHDGAYPAPNVGLIEFTGKAKDMGRFRVPSLRNVAVTAPFMHDGSIATLEEVMAHYAEGGRTIAEGAHAGVGSNNPHLDPLLVPLPLTVAEQTDIIAFLKSLTDEAFLSNPAHGDPWR